MSHFGRRKSVDSSSSSDSDSKKDYTQDRDHKQEHHHIPFIGGSHQAPDHPPPNHPPPAYNQASARPDVFGYRLLSTTGELPEERPEYLWRDKFVAYDADGRSQVYLGSARLPNAVHPCKIVPALRPHCRVPYGGGEHEHHGSYDVLPFDGNLMEWVITSNGQVPQGRQPVVGGYEDHGAQLYHALARVNGVEVPGKTATHLVSFIVILCVERILT